MSESLYGVNYLKQIKILIIDTRDPGFLICIQQKYLLLRKVDS